MYGKINRPFAQSFLLVFILSKKSTIINVHFLGGGGGHEKEYSLYSCENVEPPLIDQCRERDVPHGQYDTIVGSSQTNQCGTHPPIRHHTQTLHGRRSAENQHKTTVNTFIQVNYSYRGILHL